MLIEFLFYYCFCFCFFLCFCFFFLIENLDRDQRRNLFAQEQSKKVFLFWMPSFQVVLEWWPVAVILITTLTKQFWQLLCHLFPERNTSENEDAVNAKEEAAICRQLAGINNEIKMQSQFYSISHSLVVMFLLRVTWACFDCAQSTPARKCYHHRFHHRHCYRHRHPYHLFYHLY